MTTKPQTDSPPNIDPNILKTSPPSEAENQDKSGPGPGSRQQIETLLVAYRNLSIRSKAQLRRLESYKHVHLEAPLAYFSVSKRYEAAHESRFYSMVVVQALLLLWRDRRANDPELSQSSDALGGLFVGDGVKIPVKIGRFQRLLAAETLEEGFPVLRAILRLFRHEPVNWAEVASLLSAWHKAEPEQLDKAKRELIQPYFAKYPVE